MLERVTKDSCSGAGNRAAATFQEDDGIDARFRNKLTDFQMSGYDRGHMVGLQLPNTICDCCVGLSSDGVCLYSVQMVGVSANGVQHDGVQAGWHLPPIMPL